MFAIGETVLYGQEGVCTIERIEEMKVGRTKAQYFVLRPIYRDSSTVFIPADNALLVQKMRPILKKEEIHQLLQQAPQADQEWIDDAAQRKTTFQSILFSGNRTLILQMLWLLHRHRRSLQKRGKNLRIGDEQLLRDGEKLLSNEFAYVLQISRQQASEYIRNYMEQPI